MAETETFEKTEDAGKGDAGLVSRWLAEIKAYEKTYDAWIKQSRMIVRRYRNESSSSVSDGEIAAPAQTFNILWSNTQTIGPIVYSRTPKASISRKYKDRNPVGRSAAVILERATQAEIDAGGFDGAMRGSRDDYLLTARGQMWIRYVPTYGEETRDKVFLQEDTAEDGSKLYRRDAESEPEAFKEGAGPTIGDDGKAYIEEGEPYRPVVAECAKEDHINWEDFGHTPAPNWTKVRGAWKREKMTRDQLIERFGKDIGDKVDLKLKATNASDDDIANFGDAFKRGQVYEVWDKTTGKVLWISDGYPDAPLDVIDDPLKLKDFFPCPPPLLGTTTTDTMVPVPDFMQYRAQAEQLDEVTERISLLVEAVRVAGVYSGEHSVEIEKLISRKGGNKLIAIDQWAMFAEKGGLRGVIDWLPLEQIVAAITTLQEAADKLEENIYKLTGISDIVRGQETTGQPRTAEEQRTKAQYAGMRISDRQLETERFARDGVQIVAEVIAEHFSPETLFEISGWEFSDEARALDQAYAAWEAAVQQAQAEFVAAQEEYAAAAQGAMQGAPPMQPGMEAGAPPEAAPAAPEPPVEPEIPPPPPTSREVFDQAVELLRSDRARGFTIEIETDSMVMEDQQQEAQNRTELLDKVTGFLVQALPAGEQFPALKPLFGEFLLWTMRAHKIGRTMEAHLEQAIEGMSEEGAGAQAGDPAAEAAAQADALKAQVEGAKVQVAQATAETDRAKAETDAQMKVQKQQSDAQIGAMRLQFEQAKAERDAAIEQQKLAMEEASQKFTRLVEMLDLRLKEREIKADEKKTQVDAVLGAAQIDAQADAAQRAEETKRMERPAE